MRALGQRNSTGTTRVTFIFFVLSERFTAVVYGLRAKWNIFTSFSAVFFPLDVIGTYNSGFRCLNAPQF